MVQPRFHSAFLALGLVLAGCGAPQSGDENSGKTVQTQATTPESSSTASAIEEATRSEGTPAPTPAAPAAADPSAEFAALPAPYNTASYATGKRVFKLCSTCHTVAEGGPNTIGPNLYKIFGRQIGSLDGFNYSEAVENADFIWTPEQLDQWLESPRNFLPGNRMAFQGVRKPTDRQAVIAYLMVETGWEAAE